MSETGTAKKFLRNILSSVSGYAVTVLVALFLSPFVVHSLGDESYGLWVLVVSLTGYYGLLVFVALLVVGLVYEWRQGALDWGHTLKATLRARDARLSSQK